MCVVLGGECIVQACGMWIVAEMKGLTIIVSWNKVAAVMTVYNIIAQCWIGLNNALLSMSTSAVYGGLSVSFTLKCSSFLSNSWSSRFHWLILSINYRYRVNYWWFRCSLFSVYPVLWVPLEIVECSISIQLAVKLSYSLPCHIRRTSTFCCSVLLLQQSWKLQV